MRARNDVVAEVCARICAGDSVRAIFTDAPADYPCVVTWWRWIGADADIRAAYDSAITARSEKFAEEIVAIADNVGSPARNAEGELIYRKGELVFEVSREAIDHAKLKVEARKWNASRLLPKKYGDRTILAGDADNPLAVADVSATVLGKLLPEPAVPDPQDPPREPDAD